jgi:hypothetical protein
MSKMTKISTGMLAACLIALAGCQATSKNDDLKPSVSVSAAQNVINTGDSTTVMVSTKNLGPNSSINWAVSPDAGKLTKDSNDSSGMQARFSAGQPGTYLIKATAKAADGTMVSDETHIVVNGPIPMK